MGSVLVGADTGSSNAWTDQNGSEGKGKLALNLLLIYCQKLEVC
jgi:hypothetical protein